MTEVISASVSLTALRGLIELAHMPYLQMLKRHFRRATERLSRVFDVEGDKE